MRSALTKIYGWLASRITPGIRNSQYAYLEALERHVPGRRRWLDTGCGHHVVPEWMSISRDRRARLLASATLVGVDLDLPSLRKNEEHDWLVFGRIDPLPFAPESFDIITSNMVAEHLEDPLAGLVSVREVLMPGGRFVFHTPNLRSPLARLSSWLPQWIKNPLILLLEGRHEDDVFPTRYRLNTESAIRELAADAGLDVLELEHVETTATTSRLGPLSVFELLWIRLLRRPSLAWLRTNLVVVLQRPDAPATPQTEAS